MSHKYVTINSILPTPPHPGLPPNKRKLPTTIKKEKRNKFRDKSFKFYVKL
jgi:hypothetical protein